MAASSRVAVVAFDAMDAGLTLRLADAGRLPNFAALLDRSWSSPIENPRGLLVGSVWPTLWSGSGPGRHGFYCFRQFRNGAYEVVRRSPGDITVEPLWGHVSRAGRRYAVIDAPMTRVYEGINGVQTVEWGTHDRIMPFGTAPAELRAEVLEEFGPHPVGTCDVYSERGDLDGLRRALFAGIGAKQRMAERYLTEGPWDLFVVGHGETHCAGHQFWSTHDEHHDRHDPSVRAALGDPLVDVYVAADAALGRHLASFDDDVTVFVILSHGFGPHYDGDHLLRDIVFRLDEAYAPRSRVVELREGLIRRLNRARRRRRGAVAIDGSRRFYRVPNNELFGGIRLNLVGREPRGMVRPGREADDVVDYLRRELCALRDPDTGRPLVTSVLRTSDLFPGPALDQLPDLLVDWVRTAPITGAASPTIGVLRGEYHGVRTGDHRPTGYLIVAGPRLGAERRTTPVRSIDVSPTIAALLGVDMTDVEGSPVAELIDAHR